MKGRPPTHIPVGREVTHVRVGDRLVPMHHYRTACGRSVPPHFVARGEPTCKECGGAGAEAGEEGRPYEGLELGGLPACPYCGEDLSQSRPEPEWCPSCGAEVEERR